DVVGDKNQHRVGVRIPGVFLDGFELVLIRPAAEQILHSPHKKHLKRRHQRGRACAVEHFHQFGLGQIEFKQAEFAQIAGYEGFENRIAALLAEENFVAHENVNRPQLASLHFRNEAFGLGEGTHQKASRTLETRVRAKSWERRRKAGESSSKKLLNSSEISYCSRNVY